MTSPRELEDFIRHINVNKENKTMSKITDGRTSFYKELEQFYDLNQKNRKRIRRKSTILKKSPDASPDELLMLLSPFYTNRELNPEYLTYKNVRSYLEKENKRMPKWLWYTGASTTLLEIGSFGFQTSLGEGRTYTMIAAAIPGSIWFIGEVYLEYMKRSSRKTPENKEYEYLKSTTITADNYMSTYRCIIKKKELEKIIYENKERRNENEVK